MPDVSINTSVDDHMSSARLPIVDISSYLKDGASQAEREATQQSLDSACREFGGYFDTLTSQLPEALTQLGFFYVTGHGLETDYLKSLLQKGHQFFQLPHSTKESIHIGKSMDRVRGWQKVSNAEADSTTAPTARLVAEQPRSERT